MAATTGKTPIGIKFSQLCMKLNELVPEWEILGVYLEVPREQLRVIQSGSNSKKIENKFLEMLKKFKKQEEDDYTWKNVCEALRSIGNNRVASTILKQYGEGKIEVDEVDLSIVLKDCLPDWTSLGLMLGISKTDIDIIDDRDPYSKYLREMISYWLENSNEPFWEVLIDAIDSLQNRRLANALKEEFLQ